MNMDSHDNEDQSIEKHSFMPDAQREPTDGRDHGEGLLAGLWPWMKLLPAFTKRLSLDRVEKTALAIIALVFLSLAIWGVISLQQKNQLAQSSGFFQLPARGKYARIAHCTSYWKTVDNVTGVKMGAVAIPAASITLDKSSSSGALRVYFRDTGMNTVGDPVTVGFMNGMFSNGKNSIEFSASDGFHDRVDFDTYQLGAEGAWHLEILEARGEMEPRANFSTLFSTRISPNLR